MERSPEVTRHEEEKSVQKLNIAWEQLQLLNSRLDRLPALLQLDDSQQLGSETVDKRRCLDDLVHQLDGRLEGLLKVDTTGDSKPYANASAVSQGSIEEEHRELKSMLGFFEDQRKLLGQFVERFSTQLSLFENEPSSGSPGGPVDEHEAALRALVKVDTTGDSKAYASASGVSPGSIEEEHRELKSMLVFFEDKRKLLGQFVERFSTQLSRLENEPSNGSPGVPVDEHEAALRKCDLLTMEIEALQRLHDSEERTRTMQVALQKCDQLAMETEALQQLPPGVTADLHEQLKLELHDSGQTVKNMEAQLYEFESMRSEHQQLKLNVLEHEDKLSRRDALIEALQQQPRGVALEEHEEVQRLADTLKRELDGAVESHRCILQQSAESWNEKVASLEAKMAVSVSTSDHEVLKQELQRLRTESATAVIAVEHEVLQQELQRLQAETAAAVPAVEHEALKQELQRLQAKTAAVVPAVEHEALKQELQRFRAEIAAAVPADEHEALKQELQRFRVEIAAAVPAHEHEGLKQEFGRLRAEMATAVPVDEHETLKLELQMSGSKLQDANFESKRLTGEIESLMDSLSNISSDNATLKMQVAENERSFLAHMDEHSVLRRSFEELQNHNFTSSAAQEEDAATSTMLSELQILLSQARMENASLQRTAADREQIMLADLKQAHLFLSEAKEEIATLNRAQEEYAALTQASNENGQLMTGDLEKVTLLLAQAENATLEADGLAQEEAGQCTEQLGAVPAPVHERVLAQAEELAGQAEFQAAEIRRLEKEHATLGQEFALLDSYYKHLKQNYNELVHQRQETYIVQGGAPCKGDNVAPLLPQAGAPWDRSPIQRGVVAAEYGIHGEQLLLSGSGKSYGAATPPVQRFGPFAGQQHTPAMSHLPNHVVPAYMAMPPAHPCRNTTPGLSRARPAGDDGMSANVSISSVPTQPISPSNGQSFFANAAQVVEPVTRTISPGRSVMAPPAQMGRMMSLRRMSNVLNGPSRGTPSRVFCSTNVSPTEQTSFMGAGPAVPFMRSSSQPKARQTYPTHAAPATVLKPWPSTQVLYDAGGKLDVERLSLESMSPVHAVVLAASIPTPERDMFRSATST